MPKSREKTFAIIKSAIKTPQDKTWLAQEVANLGSKHSGLDDIPIESVLILADLYVNSVLDSALHLPSLSNHIDSLNTYQLIKRHPSTENIELTDKGESACGAIFSQVSARSNYELKRQQ
jgi:hypothetical protein